MAPDRRGIPAGDLRREAFLTIFVTVGSTDFDALIRKMDAISSLSTEEVVMQIGSGRSLPQQAREYFRYASSLDAYYDHADIIVSHGGLGTVMEALRKGKKLIAVSNPDRYDAHQDDLLQALAEAGHLIWCRDLEHLEDELQRVRAWTPVPYREPECRIHIVIQDFLRRRWASRPLKKTLRIF